jgi:uncharacterized membrane protein
MLLADVDMGQVHLIIQIVLRWIHILAGIIWIGHLYFFNVVQGAFEGKLDADTKKKVIPELRPRALFWFRWGAMITMLAGVALIGYIWSLTPPKFEGKELGKNLWILFGMTLGLIMWFNVWFIIWPNQQVIINGIKTGNKAPDHDARIRKAFLASRFNVYVSAPMLLGMVFGSHVPMGGAHAAIGIAIALAVGLGTVHHLIGMSGKVGTEWSSAPPPAAPPAAPPAVPPAPPPAK